MTPETWLELARADAKRRGLDGILPVLEALARAMRVLRSAPWNESAAHPTTGNAEPSSDESR